jgi:branched-chain amino acid transport system ATP-binding protein
LRNPPSLDHPAPAIARLPPNPLARQSFSAPVVVSGDRGIARRQNRAMADMSGGEQKMVALGCALMSAPNILLVDEPSVGLAPILVSRVIAKIKELKERKRLTVLMAEQNFNQAIKVADRAYVMVHGPIEFEGRSAAELQDNPMIKRYYLGA